VSIMTAIAEKLHLLSPRKPLRVPDKDEVHYLQGKVREQLHERELATTQIKAATDAQVREAESAVRAVRGVLDSLEKKPRLRTKRNP
jgi:hypothetical protein